MSGPVVISNLDTVIANIVAHAVTVGAAQTPPITDVARADPVPRGRSCRVWWAGEVPPPGFGQAPSVLNGQLVGERVLVGWFWPVGDSSEVLASNRDKEVWAVNDAFRAAIQADSTLSGTCTDLDVQYAANDYVASNGALWRQLIHEIQLAYVEYPTSI